MSAAFTGIVKLLSELTEQTTAADTDVMPIGATSPRKITIANLKEALGIGALNRNLQVATYIPTKSGNISGNPSVKQSGNVKVIKINTTTTLNMAVGTDYLLCTLAVAQRPDTDCIKYIAYGRLTISATGGVIFNPSITLSSGQYIHIMETFI